MKQKSTVVFREMHNQFSKTEQEVEKNKMDKAERWKGDEKEGQSDYRVKKKLGKK